MAACEPRPLGELKDDHIGTLFASLCVEYDGENE
jgi:hypothetical protein